MKSIKTMLKSGLMIGIILTFIQILVSCGNSSETKLKIGYLPISECMPLFVANEDGYFKDEGLSIELVQFPGGSQAIEALKSNSVDITFANIVSAIFAKTNGIDISTLWGTTVEDSNHILHSLLVNPNGQYKVVSDLEGKIIALNNKRNIDELMLKSLMEKNNISNYEMFEVAFPRMYSTLIAGKVDGIGVVEPYLTNCMENKMVKLSNYFIENRQSIEVTSYFIIGKDKKDVHKKFINAMNKAVSKIESDKNSCIKILNKYLKLDEKLVGKMSLPLFKKDLPTKEGIDFLCEKMVKYNWIKEKLVYEDFIIK